MNLSEAIALAANGFKNKFDKGGKPYILHCIWVMNQMETDDEKILAILHDTVEDGVVTIEELRAQKLREDLIDDLKLLTHDPADDYLTVYVPKMITSKRAVKVKLKDLEHNSNISRLKGLTAKDFGKMQKYHYAYTYLSKI